MLITIWEHILRGEGIPIHTPAGIYLAKRINGPRTANGQIYLYWSPPTFYNNNNNSFKSPRSTSYYFQERLQMLEINYRRITKILKISFLGIYFAHSWIVFQCSVSAMRVYPSNKNSP